MALMPQSTLPTAVPDGGTRFGTPLTITKEAGDEITLTWGSYCALEDVDYEIYEGFIPDFDSHEPKFCTTNGLTTKTFTPDIASTYYLVVPTNGSFEGSYGLRDGSQEREPAHIPCAPQNIGECP